ncbi:MAG: hypothetical protein M3Q36_04455, partial [bacterium]|nr:hypothetical protein [bacterium]
MTKQNTYRLRTIAGTLSAVLLVIAVLTLGFIRSLNPTATAAASEYLNFQARLKTASGAIVPDGNYNIEFKLYDASTSSGSSQGSCTGDSNCLWTETRSGGNVVRVANGYMTVNLGSVTAFPGSIDWSGRHWVTMNIGGTGAPSWDGEMNPRLLLTAVPYAFKAGNVGSADTSTASSNSSNIVIQTGNASGTTSNSGNITLDVGTATGTAGTITLGAANASSLILGRTGLTTLNNGSLTVAENISVQGNSTIGNANTDTLTINAGTSGTGIRFADSSFFSCTALETDASGDLTCGTDDGGAGGSTLQAAYTTDVDGSDAVIALTSADGAFILRDAASTIGTLFAVQNSAGSTNYLSVASTGITLGVSTTLAANQSLTITGGNTASRPASPTEGMVYFDTTTDRLMTYSNGKWQTDNREAILVAASNSSQSDKDAADFVADGNTGAALDGDQVQINAALTAASGKKVVLLAGTYVADATILVPNNTTLAGVGNGTVVELADIDANEDLIENSDSITGTGVVIRDMKLDGRDDLNTAGFQSGIFLNGIGDVATSRIGARVTNLTIEDFRSEGLYASGSDNNIIENNKMHGMMTALYLYSNS